MRPGLVAVGIVLLVLGTISVVLVLPSFIAATNLPSAQTSRTSVTLLGGASQLLHINGTDTSSGSFSLTWTATLALNVTLYERGSCSASDLPCILGNVAAHWASNTSGTFSASGTLSYPYLLNLRNPNTLVAVASPSWVSQANSPGYSLLATVVLMLTGVTLAIIGGLALYLGLFLRGGVYSTQPPIVSQSADDLDDLDSEWSESESDSAFDEEQ